MAALCVPYCRGWSDSKWQILHIALFFVNLALVILSWMPNQLRKKLDADWRELLKDKDERRSIVGTLKDNEQGTEK